MSEKQTRALTPPTKAAVQWGPTWAPDSQWIVRVTAPGEPLCEVGPFDTKAAAEDFAVAHQERQIFTQVLELLGAEGTSRFWDWLQQSGRSGR